MTRPRCCRQIAEEPNRTYFKPRGVPLKSLEVTTLALDEFEALRLADYEGLYHERAADQMGISRQTFGRIVESARRKVADALFNGKALLIKGGDVIVNAMREFLCTDCKHTWQVAYGTARPAACPSCAGVNIHRADRGHGGRHGHGGGRGRGRCGAGPRAERQT